MPQLSLFPDGFELQEQAQKALQEFELARAAALVARARNAGAGTANLAAMAQAIAWLQVHTQAPPDPASGAWLLREIATAALTAGLPPAAASFAEAAIARSLERRGCTGSTFLDPEASTPSALVTLLLGDHAAAYAGFRALLPAHGGRAEWWGWFGDAALLFGRPEDANDAWVRALVLGPDAVDLWRCRHQGVQATVERLRRDHPLGLVRELLLVEAWLADVLSIRAGNRWLAPLRLQALLQQNPASSGDALSVRCRRFALLLFADRTAGPTAVDFARRDEMQALAGELFARYLARCRSREAFGRGRTAAPGSNG